MKSELEYLEYKGKIKELNHIVVSDPSCKKDMWGRYEKENINGKDWLVDMNIFSIDNPIYETQFFLLLRKDENVCEFDEENSLSYLKDIQIKDYKIAIDTSCVVLGVNDNVKKINKSSKKLQPSCAIKTRNYGIFGEVTEGVKNDELCFLLITGNFEDECDKNQLFEYLINQFEITDLEKQNNILPSDDRELENGDVVEVSHCSIVNDVGGTTTIRNNRYKSETAGMNLTIHDCEETIRKETLGEHDKSVNSNIEVEVTNSWYDYETGYRYTGKVKNSNLIEEIRKAGTTGYTPKDYKKYGNELYEDALKANENFDPTKIYFSEFDVVKILEKNEESEMEM